MSSYHAGHHAGFRSREEMQRERALTGQYRQIGIKAVVSATIAAQSSGAPRQMGAPGTRQQQFGAPSNSGPKQQR